MTLDVVGEDFRAIRSDYARFAEESGWAEFCTKVYPKQRQLVLAYLLEAFRELGCDLSSLGVSDPIPSIPYLPKHGKVVAQYFAVLRDASLVAHKHGGFARTKAAVPYTKASQLLEQMLVEFPQHASELELLQSTGSKLAQILMGNIDPLHILFRTKADRDLLEDVYTKSPRFVTGTKVMSNFLRQALGHKRTGKLRILELKAGTGGTTKHMVNVLTSLGIDFTYTFTDLSSSLVAAAKRNFTQYPGMEYMVLDIEKDPQEDLVGKYHLIISSNCVHATKSLLVSLTNARKMLRSDGLVCLLKLTRNLFWLDCVFGLLEGWWLFEDGRQHVLASEDLWKQTLLQAGFQHVDWSDDASEEAGQYRVIVGFASASSENGGSALEARETIEYYRIGNTVLEADIHYPRHPDESKTGRPTGESSLVVSVCSTTI
jgi:SAM-dependent methyltransferase